MLAIPLLLIGQLAAGAPAPDDAALLRTIEDPLPTTDHGEPWHAIGLDNPRAVAHDASDGGLDAALQRMSDDYGVNRDTAHALIEARYWSNRVVEGTPDEPAQMKLHDALSRASTKSRGNLLVATWIATEARSGGRDPIARLLFDYLDRAPNPTTLARRLAAGGNYLGGMTTPVRAYLVTRDPSAAKQAISAGRGWDRAEQLALALVAMNGKLASDDPARLSISVEAVQDALEIGLPFVAADVFARAPPPLQSEIVAGGPGLEPDYFDKNPDYRPELAAASVEAGGSKDTAKALALAANSWKPPSHPGIYEVPSGLGAAVLAYQLHGKRPSDLFDFAVWFSSCSSARCPTWRLGGAEVLRSEYPDVVRDALASREIPQEALVKLHNELVVAPQLEAVFRPALEAIRAGANRQMKVVQAELAKVQPKERDEPDPVAATIHRLLSAPAPSVFSEHALPENPKPGPANAVSPALPSGFRLVRAEQQDQRIVAIGISARLDPAGEVSEGAYWLLESKDAGAHWARPTYMGLRKNQPYVVVAKSKVPLFSGDTLTMEVEVRELDTSTITFPPVALAVKRFQTGLYLQARISDLRRDSDGDGLPDLVEERLLLDPYDPDTDHDGISDGADPVPHVPATGKPSVPPELMAQFIEQITGKGARPRALVKDVGDPDPLQRAIGTPEPLEDAPLLYIEGDRRDFRGFSSPQRLIVLTPQEVEAANKRFGVFYPMSVKVIVNRAGDRAYIEYDEGWRGGAYSAEKVNGEWKLTVVSSWIT